ncbi:putative quinol monooxygenase [Streptomyces sp. NPDC001480]|uniref:putative quinol monooxygenase n=1 Tax=Streptomyces sp. NPDC001480 TaxID=3364577 RepID=UPI0036CEB69A
MGTYAFHAKFTAQPGRRDELKECFLEAADALKDTEACELFLVSVPQNDPTAVWISEIWADEKAHTTALNGTELAPITGRIPGLLAAPPERTDLLPVGGKVPKS